MAKAMKDNVLGTVSGGSGIKLLPKAKSSLNGADQNILNSISTENVLEVYDDNMNTIGYAPANQTGLQRTQAFMKSQGMHGDVITENGKGYTLDIKGDLKITE